MTNPNAVAIREPQAGQLAVADIRRTNDLVQQVLKELMVPDHHYGVIPGTEARPGEKPRPPVLLKPGAEKLCMAFRLAPQFQVQTISLQDGHREERVTCTLTHIPTGAVVATALGSCSTMESKYRYRNAKPKCPRCGVEAVQKSKKEPGWYCWKKIGGCGATFGPNDKAISGQKPGKAENADIADQWNTVLKMAMKRSHVAATLIATGASDMFIVEEDAGAVRHSHGEDQDEGEEQQPAEQPKRSATEDLAHQVGQMAQKMGMTKQGLWKAMGDHGIEPPEGGLTDLGVRELRKLLGVLQALGEEPKA